MLIFPVTSHGLITGPVIVKVLSKFPHVVSVVIVLYGDGFKPSSGISVHNFSAAVFRVLCSYPKAWFSNNNVICTWFYWTCDLDVIVRVDYQIAVGAFRLVHRHAHRKESNRGKMFCFQFVGAPCGFHGSYTFYKALKFFFNEKISVLKIGEFFFFKISEKFPVGIGEIQLLWNEKNTNQLLASVRLYFKPRDTPGGPVGGDYRFGNVSKTIYISLSLFSSRVCVCVCARARARALCVCIYTCVCVCVWERERERERISCTHPWLPNTACSIMLCDHATPGKHAVPVRVPVPFLFFSFC